MTSHGDTDNGMVCIDMAYLICSEEEIGSLSPQLEQGVGKEDEIMGKLRQKMFPLFFLGVPLRFKKSQFLLILLHAPQTTSNPCRPSSQHFHVRSWTELLPIKVTNLKGTFFLLG